MNFEEFLKPKETEEPESDEQLETGNEVSDEVETEVELDVQKAVVESLAADKAEQDIKIEGLNRELMTANEELSLLKEKLSCCQAELTKVNADLAARTEDLTVARNAVDKLKNLVAILEDKKFDSQERNPNALALLDREVELPDRFPGETRDHVIEVVREARDKAEAEGRIRRAQLLEGVLVANEPNGTLAQLRAELMKVFTENGNVISGKVIEYLNQHDISYKNDEQYLLTGEILKRTY